MQPASSRLIQFRSEYQTAMLDLLSLTSRQVRLYDQNLEDWGLETSEILQHLDRILRSPDGSVQLLAHDGTWLERRAPRLANLRSQFSPRFQCQQVHATVPLGVGLMLGDRNHVLRRSQHPHWRGRLEIDAPSETEAWRIAFQVRWEASTPLSPPRPLGL